VIDDPRTPADPGDQADDRPEHGRDGRTGRWRRLPTPWLAGGGSAVLAAVLGVVLVWVSGESAACAAALVPPAPAAFAAPRPVAAAPVAGAAVPMAARAAPPDSSKVYKGKASHYDGGNSGGNCSFPGPPANRLYAALGPAQYAGGAACGSFLDVTGPKGTVRVMVLDRCAGCSDGKIDLSKQAFAKIADLSKGIVSVRYRFVVNPPVTGPLTFRIKRGASRWWFAVQVGNHGNPLRSVAARQAGGGWRKAKRQPDNYWVIDGGLGPGPYDIRVTDIHGNEAVATGIRLKPRKVQRSQVRLYGTAPSTPATSAATAHPASPGEPAAGATPPTGPAGGPALPSGTAVGPDGASSPADPAAAPQAAATGPATGCG